MSAETHARVVAPGGARRARTSRERAARGACGRLGAQIGGAGPAGVRAGPPRRADAERTRAHCVAHRYNLCLTEDLEGEENQGTALMTAICVALDIFAIMHAPGSASTRIGPPPCLPRPVVARGGASLSNLRYRAEAEVVGRASSTAAIELIACARLRCARCAGRSQQASTPLTQRSRHRTGRGDRSRARRARAPRGLRADGNPDMMDDTQQRL